MELQKKKKIILIVAAVVLLCALAAIPILWKLNTYSLELSVPDKTITLEYGVDEVPEITALCKGSIFNRKGTPVETTMEGDLNLEALGTYNVTFTAEYRGIKLSEKRTFAIVDTIAPLIKLVSNPEYFTSPVETYAEEGFTATDNYDGDITSQVVREEHDGVVTYTVTDSSGNTATIDRKIVYKDAVSPSIILTDGAYIYYTIGNTFVEPGYTATDDCDGDITSSVTVEGTVDGYKYGTYVLTYRVTDSSGNTTELTRTVKVGDFTEPALSLQGNSRMYIKVGETYIDPGYKANDNIDGDLTSKVIVNGSVDTSKMGINTITYTVSDAAGNKSTATRSVYVYQKQAVSNTVNPGDKVVYLTFDDGPSKYTSRLLDILDKYGVKATFFVTNQFSDYQYMIGESHRRGHTIALHTYSHRYEKIYQNEAAYYDDLTAIHNIVVQQTGVTPTIIRFPGGTNNTVSRNYCKGIMTALTESISYYGYLYCDWNVSSADAGGAKTSEAVANNVIAGIQKHNVSVVLQHDISSFSVEAVDDILFWGIQNGYTFLPMNETTPMVHFKPQN